MFKKIKIGLSAGIAFAFMFATSVSVVAQERVNDSKDNTEIKESVEANTLATTVQKLKADRLSNANTKAPIYWFVKDQSDNTYSPAGQGDAPNTGDCIVDETALICAIGFDQEPEGEVTVADEANAPHKRYVDDED